MTIIEKKEKNLNHLINKLNSLTLTYSQPTYELEKIKSEKNEILRQKDQLEKKNAELLREHKYLRDKIANLREWRHKTIPLVNVKAMEQCPHGKEWPRPGIPV